MAYELFVQSVRLLICVSYLGVHQGPRVRLRWERPDSSWRRPSEPCALGDHCLTHRAVLPLGVPGRLDHVTGLGIHREPVPSVPEYLRLVLLILDEAIQTGLIRRDQIRVTGRGGT